MLKNQKLKLLLMIILTLVTIFSLTGCGKIESTLNSQELEKTEYPLSITDGFGVVTELDKKPERIISLTPNITEIICALGLEKSLVGRTEYCDYPESVSSIESVGDISTPNMEKIVELNPDVIISDGMQSQQFGENLRALGLKVIELRSNSSIEGTYDVIKKVGEITDTNVKANEIINNMKQELENIKSEFKDKENVSVYYCISFGEYGEFTAGKDTYINDLFNEIGLKNIADDLEGWTYGLEKIQEKDPDYIICSKYFDTKSGIMSYEGFKNLTAVKEGRVIEIDNNLIDRQGPRNFDGAREIMEKIYY